MVDWGWWVMCNQLITHKVFCSHFLSLLSYLKQEYEERNEDMAGYSFLSIDKIKDYGTLSAKYNHNLRIADVSNAIPELKDQNEELVKLNAPGYAEAVKERIDSLEYHKKRKPRSDAVKAYELVLTFSKDDAIDIEAWKEKTVEWLKDTFNIAPDGKDNVLHVMFHGDEVGNAHCHAIVCPVDNKGHLNARYFTGGSRKMTELQTSYAKAVEDLGLKRGVHGSSAFHKDIKRLYAELNNAIAIPDKLKGESSKDYIERVKDHCQTWKASTKKQLDDNYRRKKQQLDSQRNDDKELINEELNKTRLIAEQMISEAENKVAKSKKEMEEYIKHRDAILAQINKVCTIVEVDEIIDDANKYKAMDKALSDIGRTRPEDEIAFRNEVDELLIKGGYVPPTEMEIEEIEYDK